MTRMEQFRSKIDEIASRYPEERERIEKCASIIGGSDSDMLHQAFEKQLKRIAAAPRPDDARKQIDKMEHTLTKSRLISPLLETGENSASTRAWIIGLVLVSTVVVIVAGAYLEVLSWDG